MDSQMNSRAAKVAEVFAENHTQPFNLLLKTLRERLGVKAGLLSIKMSKARIFIDLVEAGKRLMDEKEKNKLLELFGLNDGLAGEFTEKWRKNYQTGIEKIFDNYAKPPLAEKLFTAFFKTLREAIGQSAAVLSTRLGKHANFISQMEEKNAYFPKESALAATAIFNLQTNQTEAFMAKWKNHYGNWQRRKRGVKRVNTKGQLPKATTVSQEALEDFFLDYGNDPFHIFFKKLRELLGVATMSLATALGQEKGFIDQFERSTTLLPEDLAKKCVEIFNLGQGHATEFLEKWEEYAKEHLPPVPRQKDENGQTAAAQALPGKTASREEITETPLVRFAQHLCVKAGIDGLQYLQRNGEIHIANLGPNVNNCTRLLEVCKLAKKLKLMSIQIHELATVLFANHYGKYRLVIEGGNLDFIDQIIGLTTKGVEISIYEEED